MAVRDRYEGPPGIGKDLKILALIGQKDKTITVEKRANTTMGDIPDNRPAPEIRKEKVRSLRQQFVEDKYDIDKRLNVASDKLWEALMKCGNVVVENMRNSARNCERGILLVDDYLGILRTLETLINSDSNLKVSAVATNVGQALKAIENQSFDLAVVDIALDGANGLELTEVMTSQCPDMPVVIFSSHEELSFVKYAFRAGARGYVVKSPDTAKEILTAIHQVLDGGIYISRRIAQELSANDIEGILSTLAGDDTQQSRICRPEQKNTRQA